MTETFPCKILRRHSVKLRARTFWLVSASLLAFYVVLYLISATVFLEGFSNLEQREMQRRIERGQQMVKSMLTTLALHARDWANWDDTYAFVENGNEEYVRSNLPVATFAHLDVDMFLYFRPDGSLFTGFENDNGKVAAPFAAYVTEIQTNRRFVETAADIPFACGVIRIGGRPLLVASAPILTSESKGPSRGTLLIGRFLTEKRLQQAAKTAELHLSLVPDETSLPLSIDAPALVRVESSHTITGYFLFCDDMGHTVTRLRVDAERWIFQQGKSSQRYLMANLAAAAVMFVVVFLVLLHRLVLARVIRLEKGLSSIRDAGEPNVRLPVEGTDELGKLAATINETLDRLQKAQQLLRHDALHDPLTGLANRSLFFQQMDVSLLKLQSTPSSHFAVLLIDLDHFKRINDSLGHEAGDKLLTLAAERLRQSFRKTDTVARLGGDEFAVLLDPIVKGKDAENLAQHLLKNLQETVLWDGHPMHLAASIGIAVCTDPGSTVEQLVREADMAMYSAKRKGKNNIEMFNPSMKGKRVTDLNMQKKRPGGNSPVPPL